MAQRSVNRANAPTISVDFSNFLLDVPCDSLKYLSAPKKQEERVRDGKRCACSGLHERAEVYMQSKRDGACARYTSGGAATNEMFASAEPCGRLTFRERPFTRASVAASRGREGGCGPTWWEEPLGADDGRPLLGLKPFPGNESTLSCIESVARRNFCRH